MLVASAVVSLTCTVSRHSTYVFMKKIASLFIILFILTTNSFASSVDTIVIPSKVMNKSYKAVVVLPSSYSTNTKAYPVLYLLHGGYGHYNDWILKTPDRA